MQMQLTPDQRAKKRQFKTELSALAGFLDIGVGCLLIARLAPFESFLWGIVGAVAFGLLYVAVSVAVQSMGGDAEAEPEDGGITERMERLREEVDAAPDDEEPEPWLIRTFWSGVAGLFTVVFALGVIFFSYFRTVATILVFAALSVSPSVISVLGTLFVSIALQMAISATTVEPRARRHGFEL